MKNFLLILAAGLAMTTIGAQADDETYYSHDAAGYVTYKHSSTSETFTTRDSKSNILSERTHYFKDDAVPAPAPFFRAATNTVSPSATPSVPAVHAPAVFVTQAPVTVIEGALTPEQIQRLVNGK